MKRLLAAVLAIFVMTSTAKAVTINYDGGGVLDAYLLRDQRPVCIGLHAADRHHPTLTHLRHTQRKSRLSLVRIGRA